MVRFMLLLSILCGSLWLVCMDVNRAGEIEVLACSRQPLSRRVNSTGTHHTNSSRGSKRLIVKLIAPLLELLAEVGIALRTPGVHCEILLLVLVVCRSQETRLEPEKRHHVADQFPVGFPMNLVKRKRLSFV
jgi:hypothetical protein